jgi:hypothetical protein
MLRETTSVSPRYHFPISFVRSQSTILVWTDCRSVRSSVGLTFEIEAKRFHTKILHARDPISVDDFPKQTSTRNIMVRGKEVRCEDVLAPCSFDNSKVPTPHHKLPSTTDGMFTFAIHGHVVVSRCCSRIEEVGRSWEKKGRFLVFKAGQWLVCLPRPWLPSRLFFVQPRHHASHQLNIRANRIVPEASRRAEVGNPTRKRRVLTPASTLHHAVQSPQFGEHPTPTQHPPPRPR